MSGPTVVSDSATKSTMLAISMAPPAPHLLSRLETVNALAFLPPDQIPTRVSMSTMSSITPMTPKRPKLSLKTSDLATTYAASAPSRNVVDTTATTTPTTLNTFTNTFELTYRPSPSSTVPSPGPSLSRRPTILPSSPYALNLPFGVYSILKNSPLPRDLRRPSLATASASPRTSNRRVFFPAPKKVAFKSVLEEEILTTEYVVRHADLSSSSEDDDNTSSESENSVGSLSEEKDDQVRGRVIRVDEISPRGRRKRKSLANSDNSTWEEERGREERSRSTSERRTKRKRRRWEWTISGETGIISEHTKSEIDNDGSVEEQTTEKERDGP